MEPHGRRSADRGISIAPGLRSESARAREGPAFGGSTATNSHHQICGGSPTGETHSTRGDSLCASTRSWPPHRQSVWAKTSSSASIRSSRRTGPSVGSTSRRRSASASPASSDRCSCSRSAPPTPTRPASASTARASGCTTCPATAVMRSRPSGAIARADARSPTSPAASPSSSPRPSTAPARPCVGVVLGTRGTGKRAFLVVGCRGRRERAVGVSAVEPKRGARVQQVVDQRPTPPDHRRALAHRPRARATQPGRARSARPRPRRLGQPRRHQSPSSEAGSRGSDLRSRARLGRRR